MSSEKFEEKSLTNVKTIVSSNVYLKGDLEFSTQVHIGGYFEGNITSFGGTLYIGKEAEVIADIQVSSLVLEGKLKGNVVVEEEVILKEGSELYAELKTKKLLMDDNVIFEGKCEMVSSLTDLDIFTASVSQLKDSLGSEQ